MPGFEAKGKDAALTNSRQVHGDDLIETVEAIINHDDSACFAILLIVVVDGVVGELGAKRGTVVVVEPGLLEADDESNRGVGVEAFKNIFIAFAFGVGSGIGIERAHVSRDTCRVGNLGGRRGHGRPMPGAPH